MKSFIKKQAIVDLVCGILITTFALFVLVKAQKNDTFLVIKI